MLLRLDYFALPDGRTGTVCETRPDGSVRAWLSDSKGQLVELPASTVVAACLRHRSPSLTSR